jgi:hypothetical protein
MPLVPTFTTINFVAIQHPLFLSKVQITLKVILLLQICSSTLKTQSHAEAV